MSSTFTPKVRQPVAETAARRATQICLQVADGLLVIDVAGTLNHHYTAQLREVLLDACDLSAGVVQLNLDKTDGLGEDLPAVLREALQRSWTNRCRLQVVATNPEVLDALMDAGIVNDLEVLSIVTAAPPTKGGPRGALRRESRRRPAFNPPGIAPRPRQGDEAASRCR